MPEITPPSSNNPAATVKKKTSLGRGLGSLLGGDQGLSTSVEPAVAKAPPMVSQTIQTSQEVAIQKPASAITISDEEKIWSIAIDKLVANTQQPRQDFTQEALKELAASIKEKGILQPITARRLGEREFEIIAGERRWRAAQIAGLHEVPVVLKKVSERDSLEYAIIENIQRENLNPVEEAEAFERLMQDYSLTQQEVATKLGKERSTVANSLRLLALPVDVKVMLRKQEISAGHAKVLLALEDSNTQLELAKQVVAEKLSVRATEKIAAKMRRQAKSDSRSQADALNVDVPQRLIDGLSTELQKLIGTKVSIDYADGKGKLQIHFYSDDQLTQIVEKLRAAWEK